MDCLQWILNWSTFWLHNHYVKITNAKNKEPEECPELSNTGDINSVLFLENKTYQGFILLTRIASGESIWGSH